MAAMNVFIAESNVELYLSRLHLALDEGQRDMLMRLLVEEEAAMGAAREHLESAQRRVSDGHARIARQRDIVAECAPGDTASAAALLLLETLERTQALLEEHLLRLQDGLERRKL